MCDISYKGVVAAIVPSEGEFTFNNTTLAIQNTADTLVSFHLSRPNCYSIVDRSPVGFHTIKWDHSGEYLLSLDDQSMLKIWKLGETIGQFELVQSMQLDSCVYIDWYQSTTISNCEKGRVVNTLVGPKVCFGDYAILAVSKTGKLKVIYHNGIEKLETMDFAFDVDVAVVNTLLVQDGVLMASSNLKDFAIHLINIDLISKKVSAERKFALDALKSEWIIKIVKFINSSTCIAVLGSSNECLLNLYTQDQQVGWIPSISIPVGGVVSVGVLDADSISIVLGMIDGRVEYRSGHNLQKSTVEQILLKEEIDDGFESFFSASEPVDVVSEPQSVIPITLQKSQNGMFMYKVCVCKENADRLVLAVDLPVFGKMEPRDYECMMKKVVERIVLAYLNGNDTGDLELFLKPLQMRYNFNVRDFTKSAFQYQKQWKNKHPALFEITSPKSVVGDAVMIQHLILSSLDLNSDLYLTTYFLINFGFIKEMFEKVSIRSNDRKGGEMQFHRGAYHHLAPYAIWMCDFGAYLVRVIFQNVFKPKLVIGSQVADVDVPQFIFVFSQVCRNELLTLLRYAKAFVNCLESKEKAGTPVQFYTQWLHAFIMKERVSLNYLVEVWEKIDEVLRASLVPKDQQNAAEEVLFTTGVVGGAYLTEFQSLKELFAQAPSGVGFPLEAGKSIFETKLLSQSSRFMPCDSIDNILQQNIRKTSTLKKCNRCKMHTQISIELDPQLSAFQSLPPWSNSYQDRCFCGGAWVVL